jgi:transcriptional regulator with PAS, ATPase and Fis domain
VGNADLSPETKTEMDFGTNARDVRPRPFLFLVLEAERPLTGGSRYALESADEVLIGRIERGSGRQVERRAADGKRRLTIRANDRFLSKEHAAFRRQPSGWVVEDLGSRNGVLVNGAPATGTTELNPGDLISLGRLFFVFDFAEAEESSDFSAEDISVEPEGLITLLPGLSERYARLRQEAPRNTSVTLVGETGTGKEVVARAIHVASKRSGPYLAVNCGAIPKDLIQSELFGHVKGAFSGATGGSGYIRDAHEGTLLLDEIVAAPAGVQIALLRTIQERTVTPVGTSRAQPVDVRFVAAAQRPLGDAVEAGEFRADLQARLEAMVFELPPLRERLEDVGIFVAAALKKLGVEEKHNPRLSLQAGTRLLRYEWPRNIRELAQSIDLAWGGAKDGEVSETDLPKPKAESGSPRSHLKEQLINHLRAARGNVAEVARRMGRTRPLVYHYLRRFDIDPESFRSG